MQLQVERTLRDNVAENKDTTQNTTRVAERIDCLFVHITGGPAIPGAAVTEGQASRTAITRQAETICSV